MLIIACGDSYTQGEGLDRQDQVYAHLLAKNFKASIKNLSQSGASEYLILDQVEQAVKLKPDLILIGHTSEYRWQVWDVRKDHYQGFLIANHIFIYLKNTINKNAFRRFGFRGLPDILDPIREPL